MNIYDEKGTFDNEQKKLLLGISVKRLSAKGLTCRISGLRLIMPQVYCSPCSEFGDEEKTVINLYIGTGYLSKPNIEFVVCHELQHRVDELDNRFGYDPTKKEEYHRKYGCSFLTVLTDLWNIYINGRLEKEGLYQIDPNDGVYRHGKFRLLDDKSKIRLLKIEEWGEDQGVRDAEQLYDIVWNAKEGDLSYDQLAELAKKHMPSPRI